MNEINIHKKITKCILCNSTKLVSIGQTSLGYEKYRCEDCEKKNNERTGTPFNRLEYPTDVALLVVLWYLSYKLSLRDLSEMFLERGYEFSHETVRNWVTKFTPLITEELRRRRKGKIGPSWYVDETYIEVKGSWVYLCRGIDKDGNLVDTMLSKRRNMKSAKRFFNVAKEVTGTKPDRVTTDHHGSYPRAIKETLGKNVLHRTNQYLNNRTEQRYRHMKQRGYLTNAWFWEL